MRTFIGKYWVNGAIAIFSTLLGLLAVEFAFRISQGIPAFSTENFLVSQLDLIRANTGVMQHDSLLGWRLVDNLQTAKGFTTGAYGLRMNSGDVRPPPRGAILAVGDSFTAGSGVNDDESWPAQLEQRLGFPVLNGSAGGWGVDQIVLRTEQLADIVHPSTVIIGVLAQDNLRNAFKVYGGGHKPLFVIENGKLKLTNVPVPRLAASPTVLGFWLKLAGHSYTVHRVMMRLAPTNWVDRLRYDRVHSNETGVDITCLLMDRLKRLREEKKIRVIVMVQYGAAESEMSEPPWYGPPTLRCARERGFETVDSWPAQHELSVKDHNRFVGLWLDEGGQLGHMSAAGNAFIADLLAPLFKH